MDYLQKVSQEISSDNFIIKTELVHPIALPRE